MVVLELSEHQNQLEEPLEHRLLTGPRPQGFCFSRLGGAKNLHL